MTEASSTLNKRVVNNNKGLKQTSQEMQQTPAHQSKSPPKKKKSSSEPSAGDSEGLFEATAAGASKDVNMLLLECAEVLSERAAADASQVKELDDILREAQNLESFLKEKKNHLRQTLAVISDKLQS
ncbi:testis-expressed protein 12-like [Thalassophryne amazonica]|uniref:testis-expressed protein 12-like n=1 Tax=Thalassophryne amazonica TaxID=390379 RepID=UPI0014716F49|nr:testis-expressed protein 12-like [Thalassophryne amazonica]